MTNNLQDGVSKELMGEKSIKADFGSNLNVELFITHALVSSNSLKTLYDGEQMFICDFFSPMRNLLEWLF